MATMMTRRRATQMPLLRRSASHRARTLTSAPWDSSSAQTCRSNAASLIDGLGPRREGDASDSASVVKLRRIAERAVVTQRCRSASETWASLATSATARPPRTSRTNWTRWSAGWEIGWWRVPCLGARCRLRVWVLTESVDRGMRVLRMPGRHARCVPAANAFVVRVLHKE